MTACGASHPADPGRTCIRTGPHADHEDRVGGWPNTELLAEEQARREQRASRKGARQRVVALAAAASQGRQQTLAAERRQVSTGVPEAAREKWSKEAWAAHAESMFRDFLRRHTEPFTTAEDLWPLLPCPPEMRALSIITQKMLRLGYMEERGAKRLRGVYCTQDGVEFAENKLVPIYVSLIVTSALSG